MAVTDQQVLSEVQGALLEPRDGGATFPSTLWSASEVLSHLNASLRTLILSTGAVMTRDTSIVTIAAVTRYTLPSSLLSIYSAAFSGTDGRAYALSRSDSFQADHISSTWSTTSSSPRPVSYTMGELPSLTIELMPAPNIPGSLDILATSRPTALTGAGASLPVPDELAPILKWATLAELLNKVGRSASPERAAYARYRAQEMTAAATLMLEGWA